jgi:Holliday junction resolvase
MTFARRVDTTHKAVMETLRKTGWQVIDASRVGRGFPDLLALKGGRMVLIEVKTAKGKHTRPQLELMARGWPVVTIRSVEDAAKL